MLKKALAGLATLALALGMVALTAAPASAHHNTINATVSCTDNHQYLVSWTVTNSENLTETITASSDTALIPVGTTLAPKETKTFTEIFSSKSAKTLTLSATWSNGNKSTNDFKLKTNVFPDCSPNHVPVTLCHATPPDTAAQGWEAITIDDDAIVKSGHNEQHGADIIPAFDYWEDVNGVWTLKHFAGKNLGTDFSGFTGQQIVDAGCAIAITPAAVTFAPAFCSAPGVVADGGYTIPGQIGVQYQVSINGGAFAAVAAGTYGAPVGTTIDVKASGLPAWITLTGTTTWSYVVPSPGDCIVTTAPVAPAVTAITLCGTYGSVVPVATTGVVYTLTEGNGLEGAYTITAMPAFGYSFVGPQSVEFSGDLGEYTDCATPVAPTVTAIALCGEFGSIVLPVTEGVVYALTSGDGKQGLYTVTATPADGYSFVGPQSVEFSGDLGNYTDCATALAVVFTDSECTPGGPTGGTFEIPVKQGVQYSVSIDDGAFTDIAAGTHVAADESKVVVKATALPGYTLEGTAEWEHTFASVFCPPVLGNFEVSLTSASQQCVAGATVSGSVSVSVIPGPAENPVPARFILNEGTASEQQITGTTQLAPGDYTVTARAKLPADGVYSSTGQPQPDGSWLWNVSIAAASTADCAQLTTLAYTGVSASIGALGLAGSLVFLGALVLIMRRRADQASA